jgi:hypothetical protein
LSGSRSSKRHNKILNFQHKLAETEEDVDSFIDEIEFAEDTQDCWPKTVIQNMNVYRPET